MDDLNESNEEINKEYNLNEDSILGKFPRDQSSKTKKQIIFGIFTIIIIAIIIVLIIILININSSKSSSPKEKIAEIICIYNIEKIDKYYNLLSKDYKYDSSILEIYSNNNKSIPYSENGYKFQNPGENEIKFYIYKSFSMENIFKNIEELISVNITSEKNAEIKSIKSAFENCINLKYFNIYGINNKQIKSLHKLFYNTQISNLNLENFPTNNIEDFSYMFSGIDSSFIDLININTEKATNISNMFSNCLSLTIVI